MDIKVTKSFIAGGLPNPIVGRTYTVDDAFGRHLIETGVAESLGHETKVQKPPAEVKKKGPSASSQAAPAPRKKTRKKRTKSAK